VDPLLESSIQLAQQKTPGEKLAEALELMDWGIAMQRQRLRAERPGASEDEIEFALEAWLLRDH
jgi:Rv0078B-related antitoxin